LLNIWFQMDVLAVACKQFSGVFTSPGSGAVKRFVITTSVTGNQVSTANTISGVAKKWGNMAEKSKYRNAISLGKTKYVFLKVTRNCRVHCTFYMSRSYSSMWQNRSSAPLCLKSLLRTMEPAGNNPLVIFFVI